MTLKPLLAVLLAAAAMPVAAQNAPAPGAPPMAMRHHDPAMMREMMQRMRQRHADDMALLLDLRPAQRLALDAFLAASHPGGGSERMDMPMEGAPPPAGSAPPSFTDHLDHEQALLAHRAEAGQRRIAAARAFYQGLDPHQRQLFEALMRLHHAGGHGGMGGPMGGHPGHDGPGPMGGPEASRD